MFGRFLGTQSAFALKVVFLLCLVCSADAGVTRLREKILRDVSEPAPLLDDSALQKYIDHTVERILAGDMPGVHFQRGGKGGALHPGKAEKKEIVFATVCLITGLVLVAVRIGAKAYEKSFEQFTGRTLTELGEQLADAMADIEGKVNSLNTLIRTRQAGWAGLADLARHLLEKEPQNISTALDLYLSNMFPAISHDQASNFVSPNPVVVDLNSDNIEGIVEGVIEDLTEYTTDLIATDAFSTAVDGILKGLGYSGAAFAVTGVAIPAIGLVSSLIKTAQTLKALSDTVSSCTNKLRWTKDELEMLTRDTTYEFCALFRSFRVFARMHQNIHAYILRAGEVKPSDEILQVWRQLGTDIDDFRTELDAMWDRGWCELTDTRGLNTETTDCLTQDPTLDEYMCGVPNIWVDDLQRWSDDWRNPSGRVMAFNATNTKRKSIKRPVGFNQIPVHSSGGFRLSEDGLELPPVTQLAQINLDHGEDWANVTVQGLFQERTFFPTPVLNGLSETLVQYNSRVYKNPSKVRQYAADFYQDPANNDYYKQQLHLLTARTSGAPIVTVEFCDPDKRGYGWYEVPLVSDSPDDMCPSGGMLSDNYFWGKWYLCFLKDWSMVDEINDKEVINAEKVFWDWLMRSQPF